MLALPSSITLDLRFLHLLCEGHVTTHQDAMRVQPIPSPVNLIHAVAAYFCALVDGMRAFDPVTPPSYKVKVVDSVAMVEAATAVEFLAECCEGNRVDNQLAVIDGGTFRGVQVCALSFSRTMSCACI